MTSNKKQNKKHTTELKKHAIVTFRQKLKVYKMPLEDLINIYVLRIEFSAIEWQKSTKGCPKPYIERGL